MKDGCGGRNLRELTLNRQFDSAEHTTKSRCRPRSAHSPFDPGTEGMRKYLSVRAGFANGSNRPFWFYERVVSAKNRSSARRGLQRSFS